MKESFSAIKVVKDLAGIDRVVMGCRKTAERLIIPYAYKAGLVEAF